MGLARVKILAAAFAASYLLVPAADAAGARPPLVWLKGEGNFTKSHRGPGVDRQDRHPRDRGRLLGLGALAAEPARARVFALHRRAQREDRAARPSLRHRLARGQLEGQHALRRNRARRLHVRAGRLHERAVPLLRTAGRVDRTPLAAADRPEAHHRPCRGAGPRRRPRRLVAPHRSRTALEVGLLPPACPPLRGRPEVEHPPRRSAGAAPRHRPVACEGNRRHRPRRVLDQRAVSSRPTRVRPSQCQVV